MRDFFLGNIFGQAQSPGGLAMVASWLKIFFWLEFKKKGGCSLATACLIFELDSEREWRQWNEKPLGRLFVSFDATGAVFGFR